MVDALPPYLPTLPAEPGSPINERTPVSREREPVDTPPSPARLNNARRRAALEQTALEQNAHQEDKKETKAVLRLERSTEISRLPLFDEKTDVEELFLEEGNRSTLVSTHKTTELIQLDPTEAAAAQANLDPERIRALLFD